MKKLLDNIHFYIFGIFTGIVLSGVLYLFGTKSGLLDWIYQHEALAGSLIAAIAAASTVLYLHLQIRQNGLHEEQQRQGRLDAERSILAHALDDLSGYANLCLEQAKVMASNNTSRPEPPVLPMESIRTVKACIEFAPNQPRSRMMSLLNNIQVGKSRLSDEISEYVGRENRRWPSDYTPDEKLKYYFISATTFVEISLQIQSLWDFARSESPTDFTSISFQFRISRILHPQTSGWLTWGGFAEHLSNHLDEKDYLSV
ncbi:hypothetical protein ACFO5Q_03335 [Kordiimonas lipolytica]|uniref:DUF4760 domain-containing protein n=1 Tax=Kordiimonas lipolytica TaxID=1662421 RepID=A0ABV8U8R5_9PROT|nr:hypothetical protein [Kordiimonas lipolytica]